MKHSAILPDLLVTILFTTIFLTGCNSAVNANLEEPELMTLEFTRSTYSPDQALIIRAVPNPELGEEFFNENLLQLQLSSSSGASSKAQLSPWSNLSDEEMVEAIKDGPGRAALRIKEAGQESARNSKGELVRSEEAMDNFAKWVENHDKLSVSWVAVLHPDIGIGFSEEPTVDVVQEVSNHENVEFMEPVQYGKYLSESNEGAPALDLVSVIIPADSFTWQAGEIVTAEFQKADSTVVKASATITE